MNTKQSNNRNFIGVRNRNLTIFVLVARLVRFLLLKPRCSGFQHRHGPDSHLCYTPEQGYYYMCITVYQR